MYRHAYTWAGTSRNIVRHSVLSQAFSTMVRIVEAAAPLRALPSRLQASRRYLSMPCRRSPRWPSWLAGTDQGTCGHIEF